MDPYFKSINDIQQFINTRFEKYGFDAKSVGWNNKESQWLRFHYLSKDFNFDNKLVLDVGCGLGDFVEYLLYKNYKSFNYIGLDISDKMIDSCRAKFDQKKFEFFHGDIFDNQFNNVDICILSGTLSYKFEGAIDNAKKTMKTMFDLANEGVALNFLSKNVDYELNKNQHYHLDDVMSWAKELSENVNIYDDYPLYEFTVVIKK